MQETELKVEYIKVDDLKPYEKNSKIHDKANIEAIKKSIEKYGFNDAIGIWGKNNLIVEGHGRWLACKELGIEEVPCIRLDHLTEEERREYTLLHNKTTMMNDFDFDLLSEELADLDLSDFELDWGVLDYPDKEELEENGGVIEENNPEVAVSIVFKNTMEWRKYEDKLRKFFKEIDDVKIKVGEYNEIEHSNTESI